MKRYAVPLILTVLWLLAWASDTGVLVWSSVEPRLDSHYRVCR